MRRYGALRSDRVPAGGVHFAHLVGSAADIPDHVEQDEIIYDQGQAGSCWAWSYAGCGDSWMRWNGLPWQKSSALAAYKLARMFMAGDPDVALTDGGTDAAAGVESLRRYGVMPETLYPYTDDPTQGLNDRLNLFDLERMSVAKLDGFAAILDTGAARVAAIRACIAAKIPVGIAIPVYDNFEAISNADTYDRPAGKLHGGHAIRVSGYRPGAFRITNQWSENWGASGFAWLSERFVAEEAWDPYALRFAPITGAP